MSRAHSSQRSFSVRRVGATGAARRAALLTGAACVALAALPARAQLALLPGGTADFKFSYKVVGGTGSVTTWAPTPAPPGQLPSELLQIGHGLPTLGAQTILSGP